MLEAQKSAYAKVYEYLTSGVTEGGSLYVDPQEFVKHSAAVDAVILENEVFLAGLGETSPSARENAIRRDI